MARTYGIDTSHWDGEIDWPVIRERGVVKFAIHKATEGEWYIDTQFQNNKSGCIREGIPWGAYHYFRPAQNVNGQADHFVEAVGDGCQVYILDVESVGENLADKVLQFVQRMETVHGIKPLIYTAYYFWKDNLGNPDWAGHYDLWVANYRVSQPMIPPPWNCYKIWQFSEDGHIDGVDSAVDENWFNGDELTMLDYFKNGGNPPQSVKVRVNVAALNIRSAPVVVPGTVLGYTTFGKEWEVEGEVNDVFGRKWYQVGKSAYLAGWLCDRV